MEVAVGTGRRSSLSRCRHDSLLVKWQAEFVLKERDLIESNDKDKKKREAGKGMTVYHSNNFSEENN